jgi:hypothetical protein
MCGEPVYDRVGLISVTVAVGISGIARLGLAAYHHHGSRTLAVTFSTFEEAFYKLVSKGEIAPTGLPLVHRLTNARLVQVTPVVGPLRLS